MNGNLQSDLRQTVRGLRRDYAFTFAALATLAICIGANTTVFSLVNAILLRPLPFPEPSRIVWLSERLGMTFGEQGVGPDYYSLRQENRIFSEIGAYDTLTVNWSGAEAPEQIEAAQVTPSFFQVLGTQPSLGRYLTSGEEGAQAPPVAVLSYAFWRAHLGSDTRVVGTTILLDRLPHTVIGVMPQGFDYPQGMQVWRPLRMDEGSERPRSPTKPMRLVNMLARVKPGVGEAALTAEMERLTDRIRAEYPPSAEKSGFLKGMSITAVPLQRRLTGDIRPALLAMSAAVGLMLWIACANLANLQLARASNRQREMAVRLALGASRARLIGQMFTESLLLALPGGALGAYVAWLAVRVLNVLKPLALDRRPPLTLDLPVLAFTFGLTLAAGVVFGMAPALSAAGTHIQTTLKTAGSGCSQGPPNVRFRRFLMTAELATALVLSIGAGLLGRSYFKLAAVDLGFPPDHLLTLRLNLTSSRYADAVSKRGFYSEVLDHIRRLPTVRAAAVSLDLPLSGEREFGGMMFQVAGRPPVPMAQRPSTDVNLVSPEFFHTMGIPLKSGRTFDMQDSQPGVKHIVVNEAFARKIFPGENAVGRSIYSQDDGPLSTIIGVVGSIRGSALGAPPAPLIYNCECQGSALSLMRLIVRTTGDPSAAVGAVESQIYAVDRGQPVSDVRTMEDRVARSLAPMRFQLTLIGAFAAIAMLLAATGVYGVMSYLVARRTGEIGIRMALGARPLDVRWQMISESLAVFPAAVVAGLAGAWGLTRYLQSMLYGVTALDAPAFVFMTLLMAVMLIAASAVPANRASKVDPIQALRQE